MDHRIGVPGRFVQAVRELDGEYYLRREVSELLGVSQSTLKAWGDERPELAAHGYVMIGRRYVYVYTAADIAALRVFQLEKYPIRKNGLRTRRRGAVQLWNAEERTDRARQRRRIGYLRGKVAKLGEDEENYQLELLAEAAIIQERLDAERRHRYEEMTRPRWMDDWLQRAGG